MMEKVAAEVDTRSLKTSRLHTALNVIGVYFIVAALMILGSLVSSDFHSYTNLLNIVRAVALLGIVAVGVAFVTYSGHYADLSVPAIMAFSGIMAISAIKFGVLASFGLALLAGMSIGLINGLVVGYLRVNPIIWTLAMSSVLDGFLRWAYGGTQIYPDPDNPAGRFFLGLYSLNVFGTVPLIVLILAVLVILGYFVMNMTGYGAKLKLTGSSYQVAEMTGINVRRVVMAAFVISSIAASVGGVLLASLNKVGAPYLGKDYDFMAVTAVVVGGMTLAGGRGSVLGVLGGVLVIGLIRNIMTLLGMSTFSQDIIQGVVFILVVGMNSYYLRRSGRDYA